MLQSKEVKLQSNINLYPIGSWVSVQMMRSETSPLLMSEVREFSQGHVDFWLTMKSIIDTLRGSDQAHSHMYIRRIISTPGRKCVQKFISSLCMLKADLSPWPRVHGTGR